MRDDSKNVCVTLRGLFIQFCPTSIAADAASRPAGGVGCTLEGIFNRRLCVAHAARLNVTVRPFALQNSVSPHYLTIR